MRRIYYLFHELLTVRRKAEICLSNFFVRHRAKQRYPQPIRYPHKKLAIPEKPRSTKSRPQTHRYAADEKAGEIHGDTVRRKRQTLSMGEGAAGALIATFSYSGSYHSNTMNYLLSWQCCYKYFLCERVYLSLLVLFAVLMDFIIIFRITPHSCNKGVTSSSAKYSALKPNCNQYSVSWHSFNAMRYLFTKSSVLAAYLASYVFAPMEVALLPNCRATITFMESR